ncbi:unnamed protein product, partial [Coccothraustes coccothraustes]
GYLGRDFGGSLEDILGSQVGRSVSGGGAEPGGGARAVRGRGSALGGGPAPPPLPPRPSPPHLASG